MDIGELDTTRRRSSKVDGDKKKGGKKMKRSNSSSRSQSKSKQNNQDNGDLDLDGIDITMPDYYKSNTAASSPQKQIEYSPDEWIEEGVLKSETQHSFFEKDTKVESSEEEDDTPTDKQPKIAHTKFISALEKYGSSERAFHKIAKELDWTVEDTKVYSYSYFKALIRERKNKIYKGICGSTNKEEKETISTDIDTENWSFHEHILLDTLMVKHCKDSSCLEEKGGSSEWERIAYQLPGRTAQQCKIEGIRRLQSQVN